MALTLGCRRETEAVPIEAWELVVEGGTPQPLSLPAHFEDRMAMAPQTYHLTTRVNVPEPFRGAPLTLVIPHFWANVALRSAARRCHRWWQTQRRRTGRAGITRSRSPANGRRIRSWRWT